MAVSLLVDMDVLDAGCAVQFNVTLLGDRDAGGAQFVEDFAGELAGLVLGALVDEELNLATGQDKYATVHVGSFLGRTCGHGYELGC